MAIVKELPCPFCGELDLEAHSDCSSFGGNFEDSTKVWVRCMKCGAQGPIADLEDNDPDLMAEELEQKAVALWNGRVTVEHP